MLKNESPRNALYWITPVVLIGNKPNEAGEIVPHLHFSFNQNHNAHYQTHYTELYNVLADFGAVPVHKRDDTIAHDDPLWPLAFGTRITSRIPERPIVTHLFNLRGRLIKVLSTWCRTLLSASTTIEKKMTDANALLLENVPRAKRPNYFYDKLSEFDRHCSRVYTALELCLIAFYGLDGTEDMSPDIVVLANGYNHAVEHKDPASFFDHADNGRVLFDVLSVINKGIPAMYALPPDVWRIIGRQISPVNARDRMRKPYHIFTDHFPVSMRVGGSEYAAFFRKEQAKMTQFFRTLRHTIHHVKNAEVELSMAPLSSNISIGLVCISRFDVVHEMLEKFHGHAPMIVYALHHLASYEQAVTFARATFGCNPDAPVNVDDDESTYPLQPWTNEKGGFLFMLELMYHMTQPRKLAPIVTLCSEKTMSPFLAYSDPMMAHRPALTFEAARIMLGMFFILPKQDAAYFLFEVYRLIKIYAAYVAISPLEDQDAYQKEDRIPYEFVKGWMARQKHIEDIKLPLVDVKSPSDALDNIMLTEFNPCLNQFLLRPFPPLA